MTISREEIVEPDQEQLIERYLTVFLESGLLKEIKSPITDFTPYLNRKLIQSRGRPLSENLIENRR
jgi:hypothetical protein